MLWLYRLLFLPVLLVASPYYLLRMKRRGGYGEHFSQRFGAVGGLPVKAPGVRRIWLQAVSVGEMLAIQPLVEAFRQDPTVEVYLTTTTSTGFKLAREKYARAVAGIGYFPVDWWLFSRRAWRRIAPDLVILTEGERWPEHVHQALKRRVPVVCVNARLSDRSYGRMKAARPFTLPLLRGITRLLAASDMDARRFLELGFPSDAVVTTGNIKLDLHIPLIGYTDHVQLRAVLGLGSDPVILGSSTWPGEERALVSALKQLRADGLACRLLLVPRHAERRADIEAELRSVGVSYHFRTKGSAPDLVDVAVADTTGELRRLTQLADVVFVGKSLPPHEQGQTPVEAAALGKPVVMGPAMTNFRAIAGELVKAGAARQVQDASALTAVLGELLREERLRTSMSNAAQAWHRANRGAVERTMQELRGVLGR